MCWLSRFFMSAGGVIAMRIVLSPPSSIEGQGDGLNETLQPLYRASERKCAAHAAAPVTAMTEGHAPIFFASGWEAPKAPM